MRRPGDFSHGASEKGTAKVGACIVLPFPRPYKTLDPMQRIYIRSRKPRDWMLIHASRQKFRAAGLGHLVPHGTGEVLS